MTTSTGAADADGIRLQSPDLEVPALEVPALEFPALEFLVGHHSTGGWFVVETHGLAGGLFRSELDAFKFLAGDFQTRAKRIEVVRETLDPFSGTCVEIARRCREAQLATTAGPAVAQ